MLDDIEWPSLEARREKSSFTLFYRFRSGTVSLEKDKDLTADPNLRSHDSQYTRFLANSDALKNSFLPRNIPMWNSLPILFGGLKTTVEIKALI